MKEGVDISYTKIGREPQVDDSPYNLVTPPKEQLYVGWTEPGEWINLTVNVREAGRYSVDFLYTSHQGGQIGLELDGKPLALAANDHFDRQLGGSIELAAVASLEPRQGPRAGRPARWRARS